MLPFTLFFILMIALVLVDAWSTYKGLKAGRASEANPIARSLIKAVGLKGALTLLNVGVLWLAWTCPPATPTVQNVVLGVYATVAVNNLRVLRKTGVL